MTAESNDKPKKPRKAPLKERVAKSEAEMAAMLEKKETNAKLREEGAQADVRELRTFVDRYYDLQEERKAQDNQARDAKKRGFFESAIASEWSARQIEVLEPLMVTRLEGFASKDLLCQWMNSLKAGVGPTLSCALRAYLDPERAETAGDIWSFVGYNPDVVWEKGHRRPWNAFMKKTGYLIGEQFVKHDGTLYHDLYRKFKKMELRKNIDGSNANAVAEALEKKNWGEGDTATYKHLTGTMADKKTSYKKHGVDTGVMQEECAACLALGPGVGHLPPKQVDMRARRRAVKIFLSHLQEVMYFVHHGKLAPAGYVFVHAGHTHYIPPPNTHLIPGFDEAKKAEGPKPWTEAAE